MHRCTGSEANAVVVYVAATVDRRADTDGCGGGPDGGRGCRCLYDDEVSTGRADRIPLVDLTVGELASAIPARSPASVTLSGSMSL